MTRRQRLIALLFVVLSGGHAVVGFIDLRVPAWQMFKTVDRYEYELFDASGDPVDLRDYVPHRAYLTHQVLIPMIAAWVVRTHPQLAPLSGQLSVQDQETTRRFEVQVHSRGDKSEVWLSEPSQ